jgi:2-haloalkanoic acid dehalogenase type II
LIDFDGYDVVSFDCYGTLIDWEGGLVSGMRPILQSHGVDVADEEILALQARTESGLQAASEPGAYVKYRKMLGDTVLRFGEEHGFEPEPREVRALADSLRHWEPFPDTVEALKALKERYGLAVVTNADDGLFALSACHLEVEFDYIVTAEQAGTYKPSLAPSSWRWSESGLRPRSSCTWPRASSTTTARPRGWDWTRSRSTGGQRKGDSGRPRRPRPRPTSRCPTSGPSSPWRAWTRAREALGPSAGRYGSRAGSHSGTERHRYWAELISAKQH